jgi:hypothetical protein
MDQVSAVARVYLFQPFFGFCCQFCFILTSCCSHTARTAAAAGTTFRGNGPYVRIIGCASYFPSDAGAHADAAVMRCAFSVSTASRSLLQKKKHPGVVIPIPAHILPTDCQNDKSCKNTVSFPKKNSLAAYLVPLQQSGACTAAFCAA